MILLLNCPWLYCHSFLWYCIWSSWVEENMCSFFYCLFILYCCWRSSC